MLLLLLLLYFCLFIFITALEKYATICSAIEAYSWNERKAHFLDIELLDTSVDKSFNHKYKWNVQWMNMKIVKFFFSFISYPNHTQHWVLLEYFFISHFLRNMEFLSSFYSRKKKTSHVCVCGLDVSLFVLFSVMTMKKSKRKSKYIKEGDIV